MDFEELENEDDGNTSEENKNKFVPVEIRREKDFLEYLFNSIIQEDGFICGGYARYVCSDPGESGKREIKPAADLDIYCFDEEAYKRIKSRMEKHGYSALRENDIAISMKIGFDGFPAMQLIKPFTADRVNTSGTLEEVLSNFDFSVARCGIYSDKSVYSETLPDEKGIITSKAKRELRAIADIDFPEDEKVNRLRVKHIHCPIAEFYRIAKYMNKGFSVSTMEIIKTLQDWEERGDDYKTKIITTLMKDEPTTEEITEMEKLLHID